MAWDLGDLGIGGHHVQSLVVVELKLAQELAVDLDVLDNLVKPEGAALTAVQTGALGDHGDPGAHVH